MPMDRPGFAVPSGHVVPGSQRANIQRMADPARSSAAREHQQAVPLTATPMPPASLRLRAAKALHALSPAAVVLRRAEVKGARAWRRSAAARQRARLSMAAIVGQTRRAGECEQLARLHVMEEGVREALLWRRWQVPCADAKSLERLESAAAAGRGVLLSSAHMGAYPMIPALVNKIGSSLIVVADAWLFQQPSPGLWGMRLAHWRNELAAVGAHAIPAKGSFSALVDLLAEGRIVYLLFDMPGRRETRFLGKPVMLADGTARISKQSGAPVLSVHPRRIGHRVWMDVGEVLEPDAFADAVQLHAALALRHEEWILRQPQALEDPRRAGAWEDQATATGWLLPANRSGR